MKSGTTPSKIGLLCLLLSGATVGTWAITHHKPQATATSASLNSAVAVPKNAIDAQNAPSTLPVPTGNSLSDQMIAKWVAVVRKSEKDDMAWVNLGDSYMQKARETADVTYYAPCGKGVPEGDCH